MGGRNRSVDQWWSKKNKRVSELSSQSQVKKNRLASVGILPSFEITFLHLFSEDCPDTCAASWFYHDITGRYTVGLSLAVEENGGCFLRGVYFPR
jgi:hypothetical protein